jgi:hypothetical protein
MGQRAVGEQEQIRRLGFMWDTHFLHTSSTASTSLYIYLALASFLCCWSSSYFLFQLSLFINTQANSMTQNLDVVLHAYLTLIERHIYTTCTTSMKEDLVKGSMCRPITAP